MVDILFVNQPRMNGIPVPREIDCANPQKDFLVQPLALAYLASAARNARCNVSLVDLNILGKNYDFLIPILKKEKPKITMGGFAVPSIFIDLELCKVVKRYSKAKVGVWGPIPSALRDFLFKKFSDLDFIIENEPEFTMEEVAKNLNKNKKDIFSKVKGLSYRKGKKIIFNGFRKLGNLDDLPIPAYDLLSMERYHTPYNRRLPMTIMRTSRGCVARCIFCVHPDTDIIIEGGGSPISEIVNQTISRNPLRSGGVEFSKVGNKKVLNDKGVYKKINFGMRRKYNGNLVVIEASNIGSSLKLTPNHKVFAAKPEYIMKEDGRRRIKKINKISLIPANKLKKGDFVLAPIISKTNDVKNIDIYNIIKNIKKKRKRHLKYERKIQEVLKLSKAGLSTRQIAKKLNISSSTISTYLRYSYNNNFETFYDTRLIKEKNFLRYERGKVKIKNDLKLNSEFLRLGGYYLSEGHIHFSKNRPNSGVIGFTFKNSEKRFIKDVTNLTKKIFGINPTISENKQNKTVHIYITQNVLATLFKEFFGSGASNKKIPNFFLKLPEEKQIELLKGLFRGDASFMQLYKKGKCCGGIGYATVSEKLAKQVTQLLLRLKIAPSHIITRKSKDSIIDGRKIHSNYPVHHIFIYGAALERLLKLFRMKTKISSKIKRNRVIFYDNYCLLPIKKIRKEKFNGYVYNLEVDKEHSYTAEGIAISNCLIGGLDEIQRGYGVSWRAQSAERTLEEIEFVVKNFNIHEINFFDAEFTINKKRVKEICKGIIDKKVDVIWNCNARVDLVDVETLRWMKKAGCYGISYGVESINKNVVRLCKKNITAEQVENAVKVTKSVGIQPALYFMIGLPGETIESIKENIAFAKKMALKYDLRPQCTIATPYPSTEFWKMAKKEGWIKEDLDKLEQTTASISYPNLSQKEIEYWHKQFYKEVVLNPIRLIKRILRIRHWNEIKSIPLHIKEFSIALFTRMRYVR